MTRYAFVHDPKTAGRVSSCPKCMTGSQGYCSVTAGPPSGFPGHRNLSYAISGLSALPSGLVFAIVRLREVVAHSRSSGPGTKTSWIQKATRLDSATGTVNRTHSDGQGLGGPRAHHNIRYKRPKTLLIA